jgi:hypothetical protein
MILDINPASELATCESAYLKDLIYWSHYIQHPLNIVPPKPDAACLCPGRATIRVPSVCGVDPTVPEIKPDVRCLSVEK